MTGAFICPICVEDDSVREPYDHPHAGSVKAHITRKTTGEHEGESGPEFSEDDLRNPEYDGDWIGDEPEPDDEPAGDDDGDTDTEQVSDTDGGADTPETDAQPSDSAPSTDGGSGIVPESDAHTPITDSADDSATECPDCGNDDLLDADQHLDDYRDRLEEQHVELLESNGHVCRSCGGVF